MDNYKRTFFSRWKDPDVSSFGVVQNVDDEGRELPLAELCKLLSTLSHEKSKPSDRRKDSDCVSNKANNFLKSQLNVKKSRESI